jgi:CRP-like cAMP-binding protein
MFHKVFADNLENSDSKNNYTIPHFSSIMDVLKNFEHGYPEVCEDLFEKIKYQKGDVLVREGDFLNKFFFVEKGIVRSFSLIVGKERTVQLTFPSEFSGTYSNTILGVVSDVTIQVLLSAKIWVFDWTKWNLYVNEYPELGLFERINSASYIMSLNERINDLLFLSTYERYQKLINNRPQIVKRLPLKYVADYLGCTIENLSRIRSQISK